MSQPSPPTNAKKTIPTKRINKQREKTAHLSHFMGNNGTSTTAVNMHIVCCCLYIVQSKWDVIAVGRCWKETDVYHRRRC